MNKEEVCNTTLGLGIQMEFKRDDKKHIIKQNTRREFWLDLSLPVQPKKMEFEASDRDDQDSNSTSKISDEHEKDEEDTRTKKRSDYCSNDHDLYRNISNTGSTGSRKKLKLTTEQIALLEDNFKSHTTLNTGQKQELAKKLNLLPRQIEVWFQNRRARTKVKQIEQECKLLKKYCETLSDENRRLKKEMREAAAGCCCSFDHHQPTTRTTAATYLSTADARPTLTSEKRHSCYEIEKADR